MAGHHHLTTPVAMTTPLHAGPTLSGNVEVPNGPPLRFNGILKSSPKTLDKSAPAVMPLSLSLCMCVCVLCAHPRHHKYPKGHTPYLYGVNIRHHCIADTPRASSCEALHRPACNAAQQQHLS